MTIEGLAYMAYTYVNCNATKMQFDKKVTATSPIDSIFEESISKLKRKASCCSVFQNKFFSKNCRVPKSSI